MKGGENCHIDRPTVPPNVVSITRGGLGLTKMMS